MWAVLPVDDADGHVLTASGDRTVKMWKGADCVRTCEATRVEPSCSLRAALLQPSFLQPLQPSFLQPSLTLGRGLFAGTRATPTSCARSRR